MALQGVLRELSDKHTLMLRRCWQKDVQFKVAPYGLMRTQSDTTRILKYRDDDYAKYLANLPKGTKPVPKEEWRKIAPFGLSYHNFGGAFDVEVTKVDGIDVYRTPTPAPIWKSDPKRAYALYEKGMEVVRHAGLAVGLARIKNDDPHFQLPYTLAEVKEMWRRERGNGVTTIPVVAVMTIAGLLLLGLRKWLH